MTPNHPVARLLAALPHRLRLLLREEPWRVLHRGCGDGTGTRLLVEAAPVAAITGLDACPAALDEACLRCPEADFRLAGPDASAPEADVVFVTGLEGDGVLDRLGVILSACRGMCVVGGPFRDGAFPTDLGRHHVAHAQADDLGDGKRELVVVYATAELMRRARGAAALEPAAADVAAADAPALVAFHEELAAALAPLLPGGSVLEVGCGDALAGLAAARLGRGRVGVMELAPAALAAARRRLAEAGLAADAFLGDAFTLGDPDYDVVLSVGVLQRHTPDERADLLRGLASRSRRLVVAVVPSARGAWHWAGRLRAARAGRPGGAEPPPDLAADFRRAGLRPLGEAFLGAAWAEEQLAALPGLDDDLRRDLLALHRAGVVGRDQRCAFVAVVGAAGPEPAAVPPPWAAFAERPQPGVGELTADLADALAVQIGAETRARAAAAALEDERRRHAATAAELGAVRAELVTLACTHREHVAGVGRLARLLDRLRRRLVPPGSWRARAARVVLGGARRVARLLRRLGARPPGDFAAVVRRAAAGPRHFVFLPTRPEGRAYHLARALARLGHVVVFDVTGVAETGAAGPREAEPNLFLYAGDPASLHRLPRPVLWAGGANAHLAEGFGPDAAVVYDWPEGPHAPPAHGPDVVVASTRLLHRRAARPDALYLPDAAAEGEWEDHARAVLAGLERGARRAAA